MSFPITSDPVASKTGGCSPSSILLVLIFVIDPCMVWPGTNALFIGILNLPSVPWIPKCHWQARAWILARGGVSCPLMASSSPEGECALLVGSVDSLAGS